MQHAGIQKAPDLPHHDDDSRAGRLRPRGDLERFGSYDEARKDVLAKGDRQ